MRFDCGLSAETKRKQQREQAEQEAKRLMEWHDHFAWWPIRMGDNDCRWLETVERKVCCATPSDDWLYVRARNTAEMTRDVLLHGGSLRYDYRPKPKPAKAAVLFEYELTLKPVEPKKPRKKAAKKKPALKAKKATKKRGKRG